MILYYYVYILLIAYVIKTQKRALHMLQQNLYNENNRYLRWIFNNKNKTIFNFSLYGILFSILILMFQDELLISCLIVVMLIIYLFSYFNEKKMSKTVQNKKPLVYTKRIKRLVLTLSIIYLIPIIISILNKNIMNISLIILSIFAAFNFIVTYIALIMNYPIEKLVYKYYENSAKNKLKSMKQLKVIGITGSYGKTSCKNILNDILNIKYNCLATPKSLNTFNGLMITINNKLKKFDDIFIAEMGAYVRGEINGLCELVNPKYGIITSIGMAHLETFGSEENIVTGKMELIEHLPNDGIGILNGDDEKQINYHIKNNCKIIWIGINNKSVDVLAKNIKSTNNGTTFYVIFKGDNKQYKFETKLLGKHNVYNILSAIALGREFNITIEKLQQGVKRVQPIEHRLELRKFEKFYQIDDAYNSNPIGAKSALEVLNMMSGLKIVVTPGMIELGKKEYELNKEFGIQISEVADKVILIGKKQTKPILDGLKEKKFNEKNIYIFDDVRESYSFLNKLETKKEIYALYENDLPDTYNE